ncbi:MAG TPA: DNA polymerase III subunit delta [Alphaproteobacteria bacterium]|nr:DNA polymerase III subunit delta [Alphaproteobacteria bacterium]
MATCYGNQLGQKLKEGLPGLLLLWGDDAGALRQAAEAAIKQSGLDPNDPFGSDKLTLTDIAADPTSLPAKAATIPFGGGKRLITLGGLTGNERAEEIAALTDAVKATLQGPLENCFIVLAVPKHLEKKSPLVKAAEAHPQALAVRFYLDKTSDLSQYLQNAFNQAGKKVESHAIGLLAQHLGADRDIAAREVEKLCLYAGDETITEDHVRQCVAGAIPIDVFRLAEAVGARDKVLTDRLTQNLLAQGEDLNGAFMVVLRHLQNLKAAQAMLKEGLSTDEVLTKNGKGKAPPDAKKQFLGQIQSYPAGRLATLPVYALDTISAARSGLFSGQLPLARALLALSS